MQDKSEDLLVDCLSIVLYAGILRGSILNYVVSLTEFRSLFYIIYLGVDIYKSFPLVFPGTIAQLDRDREFVSQSISMLLL